MALLALTPVDEIMYPLDPKELTDTNIQEFPSLDIHATILDALNYYKQNKTDKIIINKKDGQLKGLLTRDSIIKRISAALEGHPMGHDKTMGNTKSEP